MARVPITIERKDINGKGEIDRIDLEGTPKDITDFLKNLEDLDVLRKITVKRTRGARDRVELYGNNHPSPPQ